MTVTLDHSRRVTDASLSSGKSALVPFDLTVVVLWATIGLSTSAVWIMLGAPAPLAELLAFAG